MVCEIESGGDINGGSGCCKEEEGKDLGGCQLGNGGGEWGENNEGGGCCKGEGGEDLAGRQLRNGGGEEGRTTATAAAAASERESKIFSGVDSGMEEERGREQRRDRYCNPRKDLGGRSPNIF